MKISGVEMITLKAKREFDESIVYAFDVRKTILCIDCTSRNINAAPSAIREWGDRCRVHFAIVYSFDFNGSLRRKLRTVHFGSHLSTSPWYSIGLCTLIIFYSIESTCMLHWPLPIRLKCWFSPRPFRIHYLMPCILHLIAGTGGETPSQRVLVNGTAQMKCDIATSMINDKALLVVWYKNNLPIYR